jgi:hypothetical protein
MANVVTNQLHCDRHGVNCREVFPSEPVSVGARKLRENAAVIGWEVMRGAHGKDVCPPCRIGDIQAAERSSRDMPASKSATEE